MAGSHNQHATATIQLDGLLANLIDTKLYTASTIAEQLLAANQNVAQYEMVLAALRQVSENQAFKVQVDGILKVRGKALSAWYGSTWKELSPAVLHFSPQPTAEEDTEEPKQRLYSGKLRSLMRMSAVAVVVLIFGIFIGKGRRVPFEPSPSGQHPLLVLNCPGTDTDSTVRQMVETILDPSGPFRTVPASRVDGFAELHYLCDNPDRESLVSLADSAGADFILWGAITFEDDELVWNGNLYQRNGGNQPIMARAPTPLLLSETIAKSCLSLLDSEEDPLPALSFFSTNPGANFLYSEAMVQFNKGNYNGALPFFERAGNLYDRNFYMARNMWARCLYRTGDVRSSRIILEELLEHKDEISQPALVSIYRSLSRVYYMHWDGEAFRKIISEAIALSRDHYKTDYLYFLQLEAHERAVNGDYSSARTRGLFALESARKLDDPETLLNALFYIGSIELEAKQYDVALSYFDEGLFIARDASLLSGELRLLDKMATAYLRLKDGLRLQAMIQDLQDGVTMAEKRGLHEKSLILRYRIGRCLEFLGERARAIQVFDSVARQAYAAGYLNYEVRSKVVLIKYLLVEGKDVDAERLLEPLFAQVENLSPRHAIWLHDRYVHIYYHREEYTKALDSLSAGLQIAEQIGDDTSVARNFNNRGELLEKLGRMDEAGAYYGKALALKASINDPTIGSTLKNLIRLYSEMGRDDKVETYTAQMNDLD